LQSPFDPGRIFLSKRNPDMNHTPILMANKIDKIKKTINDEIVCFAVEKHFFKKMIFFFLLEIIIFLVF
jgi:hypothetical protein